VREEFADDEFGAGLVEEQKSHTWENVKPFSRPPEEFEIGDQVASRPGPIEDEIEDEVEDDGLDEFETESASRAEEETAPRRKRRRRRRRGRGGAEGRPARPAEPALENEELASEEEDEEELDEEVPFVAEEPVERAEDEERRGRRGGRRRRRSGERPARSEAAVRREERGMSESVDLPEDEEVAAGEETAARPMSYENVPTWEEAISYLVRSREGGSRSGPPRRR
jgi:ribonuclease E